MSERVSAVETGAGARSFPVFLDFTLRSRFALKRGLFLLLVPLPALAVCLHFRLSALGFLLMAVGFWPFPFRLRVDEAGVRMSWLLVNERVAWDDIRAVAVAKDGRRGVIGKPRDVLAIDRFDGSRMVLRGRTEVLAELVRHIAPRIRPQRA